MITSRRLVFRGKLPLGLRVVALILIPIQLTTAAPVIPLALADISTAGQGLQPELSPPVTSSGVKTPVAVPHAPEIPKFDPPSNGLRFSAAPTDQELMLVRLFEEPLAPLPGDPRPNENADLAQAIALYKHDPRDLAPLEAFLARHPDSRWNGSLLANLGLVCRSQGSWTKALASFEAAWKLLKDGQTPRLKAVGDRTLGELAQLNGRLGHFERLESLFQETKARDIQGAGTERVAEARAGLWLMKNDPGEAFRCGPLAVSRVHELIKPNTPLPQEIADLKSTAKGTNLAMLAALCERIKLDLQVAYRAPGAPIVVPSVVHWKVGHFAALSRKVGDTYLSQDPTFGSDTLVTVAVLDQEASGYFLVPTGELPAGWRKVSEEEAGKVYGAGNVGPAPQPPPPIDAVKTKPNDPCPGMADYNMEMASVSLMLADTPVGYTPPVGPAIQFTANYNHRESATVANVGNLGNKWGFEWLSFIQAGSTASTVSYGPGGGQLTYTGYDPASGNFARQIMSQDQLTRLSDTSYVLKHKDGSKDIYNLSDGGAIPRIFRTSSQDRFGHTVTYGYDSYFRLRTVTDAIGQTTVIAYALSTDPTSTDFYHITQVTDPFGRSATFQYNGSDQLTGITDVLGLTSKFTYIAGDFISGLTTPYGSTAFSASDSLSGGVAYDRWLLATDPMGGQERIEWRRDSSPVIPATDPSNLVPAGFNNSLLHYRNTFYWDKKAMMMAPGDYTKARITHWLHTTGSDSLSFASSIVESTKAPLENRVWRAYPGQTDTIYQGTSNQPSKVARILDDGREQDFLYQYNTLGNVTQAIDPLGRETDFVYDANQIDLIQVKQKNGSGYDVLAGFTYNSQHLPLTATDASGQVTTYTYNGAGQVLTITNPRHEATTFAYDAKGYLLSVTGAIAGATTAFTYDGFGRVRTVTDSEGYAVTTDYDVFDRPIKVTYPDGTSNQFLYNRLDLEWSQDRLGNWSRAMHDALRHLVLQQDELQRRTLYQWCMCGALEALIDPAGNRTAWMRDVQGRVTQKIHADGTSQSFAYEAATSRLKSVTDALGQTTNYRYFLDNALQQTSYTNAQVATPAVSFTYDAVYPRLASMADGVGTTAYTYNPVTATPTLGAGRLASVAGPLASSTVTYTYDELGRVLTRSINGAANTSSAAYDALGRVTGGTNPLGGFTYAYVNTTSRLASVTYPNGQVTNYAYFPNSAATPGNDDQRLQQIQNLGPGNVNISTHAYTYDAEGQIQTWSKQTDATAARVSTFAYDAAHQLIRATQPTAFAAVAGFAYAYDLAGNRTGEQIDASVTASSFNNVNQLTGQGPGGDMVFTGTVNKPSTMTVGGNVAAVDAANHWAGHAAVSVGSNAIPLVAVDGNGDTTSKTISVTVTGGTTRTLTYDLNGNLTDNGAGQTYAWDAENRLVKITQSSGVTGFVYDGLDRRVQETLNGSVIKQWVWCNEPQPCEEHDANNNVTKRFYFGLGEQIGGTNYFYTTDHLGSIREMADSAGAIRVRYDYDPYGRITKVSGDLEADFGFTGAYHHQSSGLSLTIYRAYDTGLGRWLSREPLGEMGPDGSNLYAYARNQPIGFVDLDGQTAGVVIIPAAALATAGAIVVTAVCALNPACRQAVGNAIRSVVQNHSKANQPPKAKKCPKPEELKGKNPDDIEKELKDGGWKGEPSREGGGVRLSNPEKRGEQVRIQPGNPEDPNPVKQGPYVRVSAGGVKSPPIPLVGNPTLKP